MKGSDLFIMNPFLEKSSKIQSHFTDWKNIAAKPYNKSEVDPYTKTRIILMNGAEFESNWFSHQFSRHCSNNELRRELSLSRRLDKQQQMLIGSLRPAHETILETTISYEQLAVDLTAKLAKRESNKQVKQALDFALLEDFDHLYRYSDLLFMEEGVKAENLVGHYTEIMPARPTIAEHRCPTDNIRNFVDFKTADILTKLNISIITAAEQQTMNYYMNIAGFYTSDIGRSLYQEIGLIEEQHVSHYGSLIDPNCTWLESLLMHKYTEAYLYYSCYNSEVDPYIKGLWEQGFVQEVSQLHHAAELLKKYEKKEWQEVIPNGDFPELLTLGENIDYVRDILKNTVNNTTIKDDYVDVNTLKSDSSFNEFQSNVNADVTNVPSHKVITEFISKNNQDYRFETCENPIEDLRDRKSDNTSVGRTSLS